MLRTVFAAGLAALLLTPAGAVPAPAPEPDSGVKALVAKALQAKGGAANVQRYRALSYKFRGRYFSEGPEGGISGTMQEQAPEKRAIRATLHIDGTELKYVQVANGANVWLRTNGITEDMDKESLDDTREQLHADAVAELRALTAPGARLALLGESKVGDKPAVGLRVSFAGRHDVSLFFDRATGLLLKSETLQKDSSAGKKITAAKLYSDYRNVSGLMVPFKMVILHDGKPHMVMELEEASVAEQLPDGTFARP
jgi:hypothetical protein